MNVYSLYYASLSSLTDLISDSLKNLYRVGPMYFRQWFSHFFAERYEEYKLYCSSGSIKKEKTLKRIEIMEASLAGYFELEEADKTEEIKQETLLSEENASPSEESALSEEDASPSEESGLSDDSAPLTDADLAESDSPANGAESTAIGENADYASVAEGAAFYTASEQTGSSETCEAEKPPEEPQDT